MTCRGSEGREGFCLGHPRRQCGVIPLPICSFPSLCKLSVPVPVRIEPINAWDTLCPRELTTIEGRALAAANLCLAPDWLGSLALIYPFAV